MAIHNVPLLYFLIGLSLTNYASPNTIYIHFFGFDDATIFDRKSSWNADGAIEPFCKLKEALMDVGYDIHTTDNSLSNVKNPAFVIAYNIMPSFIENIKKLGIPKEKLIAFLMEPPIKTYCLNYDKKAHQYFSKIFTWDDTLVDNTTYFKIYYPQPTLSMAIQSATFESKKLCTMITRPQTSKHPSELCSERLSVINFFEKLGANVFDLYGQGWDKKQYKNYKGSVKSKIDTLKKYKFCFCYENTKDVRGYVTEKIFHSLIAGCVPIYLGASNINEYIPLACFINREDFPSNEELYHHLKTMPEDRHREYVENINMFLQSKQAYLFSAEYFVSTILQTLNIV